MKLPKWSIGLSKRNLIIGGLLTAFVFGLFSWAGISGKLSGLADILFRREGQANPLGELPKVKFVPGQIIIKVKSEVVSRGVSPEQALEQLNQNFEVTKTERIFTNPKEKTAQIRGVDQKAYNFANILKLSFPIKDEKIINFDFSLNNREELWKEFDIGESAGEERGYTQDELYTLMVISQYRRNPQVEYAEPNLIYDYQLLPRDPFFYTRGSWGQDYDDLWGLKKIKVNNAWDISQGEGAVVAVIDSGVDYTHEDIQDNIWLNPNEIPDNQKDDDGNGFIDDIKGWDFADYETKLGEDNDPMDLLGHGTHVAGTIAAVGNNRKGIIGVAPKSKIMALKAGDENGLEEEDLLEAIKYATDMGAKVINMSWGGPGESVALKEALTYAYAQNITLVAAAGNESLDAGSFTPASYHFVITVGSSDHNDKKSDFSNYGSELDVIAPGGDSWDKNDERVKFINILSLKAKDSTIAEDELLVVRENYLRLIGTSMATPHVAGLAALILAKNPGFSNEQIRQVILASSDDILQSGWDELSGYGRINASKALKHPAPSIAQITSPSFNDKIKENETFNIIGSAKGDNFKKYTLEFGAGMKPTSWTKLVTSQSQIENGSLFQGASNVLPEGLVTFRLTVENKNGQKYQDRVQVVVFKNLHSKFPLEITGYSNEPFNLADLNRDGKKEIIMIAGQGKFFDGSHIYAISEDGSNLSGWPVSLGEKYTFGRPAVGDVNKDGNLEVVSPFHHYDISKTETEYTTIDEYGIAVFDSRGKLLKTISGGILSELDLIQHRLWLWDLENDGKSEIIFVGCIKKNIGRLRVVDEAIYVLDYSGQILPGWPKKARESTQESNSVWTEIASGDLDKDGKIEIIANELRSYQGQLQKETVVYVFNKEGQIINGWPQTLNNKGVYNALADLDNDNNIEIIVPTVIYNFEDDEIINTLYVFRNNGQTLSGWPRSIQTQNKLGTIRGVSVGNIDQDMKLEILASFEEVFNMGLGAKNQLIAFEHNGEIAPGWPQILYSYEVIFKELLLADINADKKDDIWGSLELTHQIKSWSNNGSVLASKYVDLELNLGGGLNQLAIDDIDGDGKLELVYHRGKGLNESYEVENTELFIWDLETGGRVSWPMERHDYQRTGNYNFTNP